MSKIVLVSFVLLIGSVVFGQTNCCQSDKDCSTGECCGVGFRGERVCTKIRAKGEVCWHYGTRDYPTCAALSHNCPQGLTCLPKNDPQDPNAYICK